MARGKRIALVALLALTAAPTAARADDAAWLYSPDHVTQIDLTLSDAAKAALADDPDEYVQASFALTRDDGTTYGPLTVGLRLKGTTSFRTLDRKAAFKLKMNEFVKGQTFLGLKKLTLNNMVQDGSMQHEMLAYEAFRLAGLPSWRTGYSYVRVNGADYGVYLNLETPDSVSLKRHYPKTQHLYEGAGGADAVPGGADLYEIDEGGDDRADLEALITGVAGWNEMDTVLDLDQMVRYWAVERYIGHWDGYGRAVPNNYYLHSDPTGRFTMLPWGTDQALWFHMDFFAPGGVLLGSCLADTTCKDKYVAAVVDVARTLEATDLDGLVVSTAALLEPWQFIDPRREVLYAQIPGYVDQVRTFIATRPADVEPLIPVDEEEPPDDEEDPPIDEEDPPVDEELPPVDEELPPPAKQEEDPPPVDEQPPPADDSQPAPSPPLPVNSLDGPVELDPAPLAAPRLTALAIRSVLLRSDRVAATVDLPAPGRVSIRVTAKLRGRVRTVCRSIGSVTRAPTATIECRLTAAARKRLETGRLPIVVHAEFKPWFGGLRSVTRAATLKR